MLPERMSALVTAVRTLAIETDLFVADVARILGRRLLVRAAINLLVVGGCVGIVLWGA